MPGLVRRLEVIKGNSTLSGSPGMEGGAKLLPRAKGQAFYCRGLSERLPRRGLSHHRQPSPSSESKARTAAFVLGSPVKDTIQSPLG